jgi:hypothetical protein
MVARGRGVCDFGGELIVANSPQLEFVVFWTADSGISDWRG